jgi:imidazolonepropionase-like amidohydrolase
VHCGRIVRRAGCPAFGYEKDLGALEPGKLADLIIVAGDPLHGINDAAKIQRVMVGGRVYSIRN